MDKKELAYEILIKEAWFDTFRTAFGRAWDWLKRRPYAAGFALGPGTGAMATGSYMLGRTAGRASRGLAQWMKPRLEDYTRRFLGFLS